MTLRPKKVTRSGTAALTKLNHQHFVAVSAEILETRLAASPIQATLIGDHRRDNRLDDLSPEALLGYVKSLKGLQGQLLQVELASLELQDRIDYQLLETFIDQEVFEVEVLQSYRWNPLLYAHLLGSSLFGLIARDYAPLHERLLAATARLRELPRFLEQARANLQNAPAVQVETALAQNQGAVQLIQVELRGQLERLPRLLPEFEKAASPALDALDRYGRFLKDELLPRATRDPRLGRELYSEKLRLSLNTLMRPDDVVARAELVAESVRGALYEQARAVLIDLTGAQGLPIIPTAQTRASVIREALELCAEDVCTPASFVDEMRGFVREAGTFVREHNLVTVPETPLEVTEVPGFMRGIGAAYFSPPGALDRKTRTYFMVAPPPPSFSPEQTRAFLREYNRWMMRNLATHETVPGHFVQTSRANEWPSLTRATLSSSTFQEGWAVYCEGMMADAGYGHDRRARLQQLRMELKAVTNAIVDYRLHVDQVDDATGVALMTGDGAQEPFEAARKWRRAQLTSCQLSTYFIGLEEWRKLRQDAERAAQARNERFRLREFHDRALSYGAPPVRFLRECLEP